MNLTVEDLKYFQQQHPDYRLELVDGAIIVMSPSGYESDEIAAEIVAQLRNWVRPRRLGRVTAVGGVGHGIAAITCNKCKSITA